MWAREGYVLWSSFKGWGILGTLPQVLSDSDSFPSQAIHLLAVSLQAIHSLFGPLVLVLASIYAPLNPQNCQIIVEPQDNVAGLRLPLDGGGIRGMSELLILQEIMQRIRHEENLDSVSLPCELNI